MRARAALMLAVLAGCPDRTISEVPVAQDKVEVVDMPAVPRRELDLLFVIDSSMSMADEQESLRANFQRLIEVLESIEGGLPDIHIGVITPNLGTSAIEGPNAAPVSGCNGPGDGGKLRELTPGGPRFLRSYSTVDPEIRDTNFTGMTLTQAFEQIALVGTGGCGIEQHLEAVKRATDGSNAENASFLRDTAFLAVVIIADEDDCSLRSSRLFDAHRATGGSLYGELTNFRCTTEGVTCDTPIDGNLGPREGCVPREDSAEVSGVDRYVEHLISLKRDPLDVIVAGIVGDAENFAVATRSNVPVLGNACPEETTGEALPAVRIGHFLEQFISRNTRTTICDGDLSDALLQIAILLRKILLDPCFDTTPIDVDPDTDGPQYDCTVTEVRRTPNQPDEEVRVIAPCERGGFPCWRIEADPVQCSFAESPEKLKLVIERNGEEVAEDIHIRASCVTAVPQ
jgi:hypothetical protein